MNYAAASAVLLLLFYRVRHGVYSVKELRLALSHHFLCLFGMAMTGVALVVVISAANMTMTWYSIPEVKTYFTLVYNWCIAGL